jgi:hypothetical protein
LAKDDKQKKCNIWVGHSSRLGASNEMQGFFAALRMTACKCIAASLLLRSILFEKLSDLCKSEGVSVDDELVFAGVVRDRDDAADTVAVLAEGLENEVDVGHG